MQHPDWVHNATTLEEGLGILLPGLPSTCCTVWTPVRVVLLVQTLRQHHYQQTRSKHQEPGYPYSNTCPLVDLVFSPAVLDEMQSVVPTRAESALAVCAMEVAASGYGGVAPPLYQRNPLPGLTHESYVGLPRSMSCHIISPPLCRCLLGRT